jgi:hypothetical protein
MNKLTKIKYYIDTLCVYDLKNDIVVNALYDLINNIDSEKVLRKQSDFFKVVSKFKSLKEHISRCILTDENVFTKSACANGAVDLDKSVIDAVKLDLMKLEAISSVSAEDIIDFVADDDLKSVIKTIPEWNIGTALLPLSKNWDSQIDELIAFYQTNGYGDWAKYSAFTWRDKNLIPITSVSGIRLNDLKNYELQRKKVVDNTISFIEGLPANNVLLYGDRGTGKSSTIHAILNEYKSKGLRMIEISKGDISDLTMIREKISDSPMKFIIFIDDLSFDSHEDSFGELKAALEGSLSGRQSNTIIYATSNRRHLIKENFSDRENDVNRSDTLQEELSLSDRFGLSITFMNPDKKDYLDITEKIAIDRGLDVDMDKFLEAAEQFARKRGGRSPRCARQFIDYVEGCIKRGIEW